MRARRDLTRPIAAAILLLAGGCFLPGCDTAQAMPPPKPQSVHRTLALAPATLLVPSAAATAAPVRDLLRDAQSLTGNIERTAAEMPALRRTIALAALGLFAIGVVNAALLAAILGAVQRPRPAPAIAVAAAPASSGPALPAIAEPPRRCACGAAISARSRTGRCRACADRLSPARSKTAAPRRDRETHSTS